MPKTFQCQERDISRHFFVTLKKKREGVRDMRKEISR